MFVLALSSQSARKLAREALRDVPNRVEAIAPHGAPPLFRGARQPDRNMLLVHDLNPQPSQSVTWVNTLTRAHPHLGIFLLVDEPLTGKLEAVRILTEERLLKGAMLVAGARPGDLRTKLLEAHNAVPLAGLGRLIMRSWGLDAELDRLVHEYLVASRPPTTVQGFLHQFDITRRQLTRLLGEVNLGTPAAFLRAVRVLRGVVLLQHGMSVTDAARALEYGSAETFRGHVKATLDATPNELRGYPVAAAVSEARPGA